MSLLEELAAGAVDAAPRLLAEKEARDEMANLLWEAVESACKNGTIKTRPFCDLDIDILREAQESGVLQPDEAALVYEWRCARRPPPPVLPVGAMGAIAMFVDTGRR